MIGRTDDLRMMVKIGVLDPRKDDELTAIIVRAACAGDEAVPVALARLAKPFELYSLNAWHAAVEQMTPKELNELRARVAKKAAYIRMGQPSQRK